MSGSYPLGTPIRPEPKEKEDLWEALDPAKPWIQTNRRTGMMRNTKPPPPPETTWPFIPMP